MHPTLKRFAINAGIVIAFFAFLFGLLNYAPFINWLHLKTETASNNLFGLLTQRADLIAVLIVGFFLYRKFAPKKKGH